MKRTHIMKKNLLIIILFLLASLTVEAVESYNQFCKDNNSERIISLNTGVHSKIYLSDNTLMYSNPSSPPLVVETDLASVSKLYEENSDFNSIELIKIRIKSAPGKSLLFNTSQLSSFDKLKCIVLVYEYHACSDNSEQCLSSMTDSLVKTDDPTTVHILFDLSIPQ